MRRTFIFSMALVVSSACSTKPGTEGASCPDDNNCLSPLRCIQNICTRVPDDFDAGIADVGIVEDGGPVDAGLPIDTGVVDTGVPEMYVESIVGGSVAVTADGTTLGYTAVTGRAFLVREETGYTNVEVYVHGLTADTSYTAHVHAKACADEVGGGHYKIDPMVAEVSEPNEIWPSFTTDANGTGVGTIRVHHYAREDAVSLVVHEPGTNEKIICGDLSPNADLTANGTFTELPAGSGSGITGSVTLRRYSGGTTATAELSGTLQADATYPAHVHAKRCDEESGGPHYKIDLDVAEVAEDNEIWPNITANAGGTSGSGSITVPHIARYDAWSIVVHDPANGDRLLCADLSF